MCTVCGEGAVTDQTCQKWFAKFCAEDFSLDGAPRSGGPLEIDSNQIESNWEQSPFYHMGDKRQTPVSKSVELLVSMKNVAFILQENDRLFG